MAKQLLAFLLLYPNREIAKEEIVTQLWGGGASVDNLNRTIKDLQKALGEEDAARIQGRGSVRLRVDRLDVDTLSLDQSWSCRSQDSQNILALKSAVDACIGPLLQGWDAPWVLEARSRYAETLRQALHYLFSITHRERSLVMAQHYLVRLRLNGDCAEEQHTALMRTFLDAAAYPTAKLFFDSYKTYLREYHSLMPPATMLTMCASIPMIKADFVPPVESDLVEFEAPEGTMSLSSRFYVERPVDMDFHTALARRDTIICIKGPRQVGKSSLLARGGEQARQAGLRVVMTDFQRLDTENLKTIDSFFRTLARTFQRRLSLSTSPDVYWDLRQSANENFDGYLQDVVLPASATPLIWCIDEADRLFDREYRGSVFGLFRSWYNARAAETDSIWNRFVLIMTYSTEAHLFIPDLHQSPFNVGTKIDLVDFSFEQLRTLNIRHDSPLSTEAELHRLYTLVGGHPYLLRLCFFEMKAHHRTMEDLEAQAEQDYGLFCDHLDRLYVAVTQNAELSVGLSNLLNGRDISRTAFIRLRSAGIITGDGTSSAHLRCALYTTWFKMRLP